MKNITVGYFDLANKKFLSGIVINENFLGLLSHYVNVKIVPLARRENLKSCFEKIEKYDLDYLYVNSYETLVESFLLRERLCLDIPFIFTIHTVFPWALNYARIIPFIRKDDIILAPSEYARESFRRISDKFVIHVFPYSLDIKHIRNMVDKKRGRRGKTITFMGRLTEKKGVGTLVKCMPELINRLGDVRLNIIGPLSGSGPTDSPKGEYVKGLEAEIKKLGLTDRVNLTGLRLGEEKYRLLSRASVFINPTVAKEETFSIVNIEALACGLPVIATDWAANKEIIINGKNGYLVGVRDDEKEKLHIKTGQLISSIVKVLTDPALNLRLREGAVRAAKRYDYRRVFPGLIKLLKKKNPKIQGGWRPIRDKTVGHFGLLFSRDFLFFLYGIHPRLRVETYDDLYDKMVRPRPFNDGASRITKKPFHKKNSEHSKIMDKISREYKSYLLLREKTT